jgi:hypothetical protein
MAVMRRPMILIITALCTATAVVAGCAHTTDGVAKAPRAHAARPLVSGDLDSVMLTPKQLIEIIGAPLTLRLDQKRPVGGGPGGPCAAIDTAGSDAFVGNGFGGYHVLVLADGKGDQHDHVVSQSAAVYPDAQSAAKQFISVTGGLQPCNGRHVRDDADWKFAVNDITPDTVLWNKEQTDVPMLWVCYGQGRVRNNVILEAMVCRGDDQGAQNAGAMIDRMSAAVWELSAT